MPRWAWSLGRLCLLRATLLLASCFVLTGVRAEPARADQDYGFEVHLDMPQQPGDPIKVHAVVKTLSAPAPELSYYVAFFDPAGHEVDRTGLGRIHSDIPGYTWFIDLEKPVFQSGTYSARVIRVNGSTEVSVAEATGSTNTGPPALPARVVVTGLQIQLDQPQAGQPVQLQVTAGNTGGQPGSLSAPVVYTSQADGTVQTVATADFTDVPPEQAATVTLSWIPDGSVDAGRLDVGDPGTGFATLSWESTGVQAPAPDGNSPDNSAAAGGTDSTP
jgi:hypothetical protein